MDWKKGLSLALKGIGAATKVARAFGVPYASMVGSAVLTMVKMTTDIRVWSLSFLPLSNPQI